MKSEIKINTIKYIDGELKDEALLQFEKLLKTDKVLQEEVRVQKEIYKSLKVKSEFEQEKEELISFLNGLEQRTDLSDAGKPMEELAMDDQVVETNTAIKTAAQKSIFRKLLPWTSLAAAAAILLFVLGPWQNQLSSTALADKNFSMYNLEADRSVQAEADGSTKISLIAKAIKSYLEKDYKPVIEAFDKYLKQNPDSPDIWLARGSAEYKENLLDAALISFEKAHKLNPAYKAIAHWYLALTHLKKEENEKAKTALAQIMKGEEKYDEAQKLMQQIESIP